MGKPTTKKLLEVLPDHYEKVKVRASKSGQTLKLFTSLLLEYGIQKLDAGQITLVDATVSDAPQRTTIKIPARKASRKEVASV